MRWAAVLALACLAAACGGGGGVASNASGGSSSSSSSSSNSSPSAAPAYTWHNVHIVGGGFITGIVAHPAQRGLLYARTDIGGAYRWNAASSSWIPLTDWITRANSNYIGIESIGLDPSDPTRLYLAAGTYTASRAGNGAMLVSTDQGATFQTVSVPIKMGSNDNGREAGERLAVDPNNGSVVYFGSRLNGLWKSTNHGASWNQVTTFPITGSTRGAGVVFVRFTKGSGASGSTTPIVYVGASDVGPSSGTYYGLYRSTDSGSTWTAVPGQPTGLYPNHGELGPDGNLYISYGNAIGPNGVKSGAIWRYTPPPNATPNDAGTWVNVTPPAPSYANNGSYGFAALAIDPTNPGVIMTSTLDLWHLYDDIWRSLDGGNTWIEVTPKSAYSFTVAPWLGTMQSAGSGWWIGAMAIDPFDAGYVLYGTGATLWGTSNATAVNTRGTVNWSVAATGIEETAVLALISPPSGASLVSGLGDVCGFVHTDVTTPPAARMSNPIFSTTTGLDFAQQVPAVVVRVGYAGTVAQTGGYSTDGGTSWVPFATQPAGTASGAGAIAVSADGKTLIWAPSDAAVAYSANDGTTWTAAAGAPASSGVVADRVNATKFYIVSGTNLYTSTNGGANFVIINGSLPAAGTLIASADAEGNLWLVTSRGLFHSTNSGTAFAAVSGVQQAYSVGFGKAATGQTAPAIYLLGQIGGNQGIYRSIDGGATWTVINDAQHQYGNATLIIGDPRIFGRVYVGTNGRGILYGDSST